MKRLTRSTAVLLVSSLCVGISVAQGQIKDFDFEVESLDGKKLTQDSFRDKVLLVDIWGTWCPPCRKMIPILSELYRKYEDRGLVVLGLAYERGDDDEKLAKLRTFVEKNSIPYPVALGDESITKQIPNFHAYPTLLYFKKGLVCDEIEVGVSNKKSLEEWIEAALEGKAPPPKKVAPVKFEIETSLGQKVGIGDGKTHVLVNLVHPKMQHSEAELGKLRDQQKGGRFRMVQVTREDLIKAAVENGSKASVLAKEQLTKLGLGKAFPAFVLLNPAGKVRFRIAGKGKEVLPRLLQEVSDALSGKAKAPEKKATPASKPTVIEIDGKKIPVRRLIKPKKLDPPKKKSPEKRTPSAVR